MVSTKCTLDYSNKDVPGTGGRGCLFLFDIVHFHKVWRYIRSFLQSANTCLLEHGLKPSMCKLYFRHKSFDLNI